MSENSDTDFYFHPKQDANYQVCKRCIMDTSDPQIVFTETGCNHCDTATKILVALEVAKSNGQSFQNTIEQLKQAGRGKPYDCVIGVSGGVDSSYVAYLLKKNGVRPLAVHLDNGWNSELAVKNVENIVRKLEIDLVTHVIDWPEFRDLQKSFFKAGVIDIEMLTDHAIMACLFQTAKKNGIKQIVLGNNYATESSMPPAWVHRKSDLTNLRSIHKKFGAMKIKTFPVLGTFQLYFMRYALDYLCTNLLDKISFDKESALNTLETELAYKRYPFKHYESVFTRFYQGFILPRKFGVDKRRSHYSALISSGQLTRSDALQMLEKPVYLGQMLKEDRTFVLKKLGFSDSEFNAYLDAKNTSHSAYPSDNTTWELLLGIKNRLPKVILNKLKMQKV
jgi:N-acetyl sugar amidotransferase